MQLETGSTVSQQSTQQEPPIKPGLLFVLSAPSGTGKDTVINQLKEQGSDIFVVPSVTTRPPRPGESEGHPYYFLSESEFEELDQQGELLESAYVHGNRYGQPRKPIRDNLRAGRDVLLKIDVQGAQTIRQKVPEAIFIFITPGSIEDLAQRLNDRQTETPAEQERRLHDAQNELANRHWYDYTIENRQWRVQTAVEHLRAIIVAEHCRTTPRHIDI